MAVSVALIASFSAFWAVVGIVVPFFIPKGPNNGVIKWCICLTSICCWMFWTICYLTQINPLVGPKLTSKNVMNMAREWILESRGALGKLMILIKEQNELQTSQKIINQAWDLKIKFTMAVLKPGHEPDNCEDQTVMTLCLGIMGTVNACSSLQSCRTLAFFPGTSLAEPASNNKSNKKQTTRQ